MWKTGDPEIATPKGVRTHRPKHSDTSLSREWRINMANIKKADSRLSHIERQPDKNASYSINHDFILSAANRGGLGLYFVSVML